MSGSKHVSVVDEHAAAVEPIEVAEPGHPRELVDARWLTANDSGRIVPFSATCREGGKVGGEKERKVNRKQQQTRKLVHYDVLYDILAQKRSAFFGFDR